MRRGFQVLVSGIVLAGLALAGAGVASAQEAAKPVLTLDGDAAIVLVLIKPDKAADFEAVIAKYQGSAWQERQSQAKGTTRGNDGSQVTDADGRQHRLRVPRRPGAEG